MHRLGAVCQNRREIPGMQLSANEAEFTARLGRVRHDWTLEEAEAVHSAPFNDLLFAAQTVHRRHFDANTVQMSRLLSIKTGGCPEDCGYCSQSAHHATGLKASKLMEVEAVLAAAREAKAAGATRYCMGAAWRSPKARDLDQVCAMVEGVKALGMETCMTLGMLDQAAAQRLAQAGLDYYNHNLDTSEAFYDKVITTRSFADRLETLDTVRAAGMKVCCGGILGLGEAAEDRVVDACDPGQSRSAARKRADQSAGADRGYADGPGGKGRRHRLCSRDRHARIMMPRALVRLSAGRTAMSDELQALCFLAGANSIFVGDTLLTAGNPGEDADSVLFGRLGLRPMSAETDPV